MADPIQPDSLLLASSSARRHQLMDEAGYRFDIATPPFEEPSEARHPDVPPAIHAESLAYFKASSVARLHPGHTILAADTIACLDGQVIGKPANRDDARFILGRLSGTTHEVISGVALIDPEACRRMLRHDVTVVRIRPLDAEEIEDYLDSGEWKGKAGAYGIQDHGDRFVERVDGSFTNVVGLPMELIAVMFRGWVE